MNRVTAVGARRLVRTVAGIWTVSYRRQSATANRQSIRNRQSATANPQSSIRNRRSAIRNRGLTYSPSRRGSHSDSAGMYVIISIAIAIAMKKGTA